MGVWDARVGGGSALKSRAQIQTEALDYADSVGGGGASLMGEGVRYVSETGSDGYDGLTERTAKRTLAAAYADLPMPASSTPAVQRIYAAPGDYDVGSGLALTRGKPVEIRGTVRTPPYVVSTATAPLSNVRCARIRSSTGAASLITTIGGTASAQMNGCAFIDLLFEFRASTTKIGIDANSAWYGEITRCYAFADKTSVPAAVDAQLFFVRDDTTYGGSGTDCSWWRVDDNWVINMALGTFGDTGGNNNHQLLTRNHGFGLNHSNTSALPFVTIVNGNRCAVIDSNIEAYNVGIKFDSCWQSREEGTGGEFVDVAIDAYNTKGCSFKPNGISMFALGSTTPIISNPLQFRGDAFTKANRIDITSAWFSGNDQRVGMPIDDPTYPAISLGSTDNLVISPRHIQNQGVRELVGTGTPEGAVVGKVGDRFWRTDGGATTTLYVKTSGTGNTGWTAK